MSRRMTKARRREELIHGAWECYQHAYYAANYRLRRHIRGARIAGNEIDVAALEKAFRRRYPAFPGYFDWLRAGEIWVQNAGTVVRFQDEEGGLICSYEVRGGGYRRIH